MGIIFAILDEVTAFLSFVGTIIDALKVYIEERIDYHKKH